jgi:hypothetical protein
MLAEGLAVSDTEIIAECFWAKNSMLRVHGQSPYAALFGRTPPLLQELEAPTLSATEDGKGGENSRHIVRMREISLQSIVEGTARERLKRASKTQTRVTGQLAGLQNGDLVDVFRTPSSKDNIGWRGPCEVISVANLGDGYVDCRWGGRALSVRVPDIRRHLVYLEFIEEDDSALQLLRRQLNNQEPNRLYTYSMIFGAKGWVMSKSAIEQPHVFRAGLNVGRNVFLTRCCGVRLGQGITVLTGLAGTSESVLLWYPQDSPSKYSTLIMNAAQQLNLRQLFGAEWLNVRFMQFIGVAEPEAEDIRQIVPDEPMLGDDPKDVDRPRAQVPRLQPLLPIAEEDVDVDMDEAMPPPPPVQPVLPIARQPVRSNDSVRSRSTRQPSRESSVDSIGSLPSVPVASSRSSDRSRSSNQQIPPAPWKAAGGHSVPHGLPTAFTPGGSSGSNYWPKAGSVPPVSNTPIPSSSTGPVPTGSTTTMEPDDEDHPDYLAYVFNVATKPPKQFASCSNEFGLDEAVQSQTEYLSEVTQTEGPFATQSCSSAEDGPEFEIPAAMSKFFVGLPQIKDDEVIVCYLARGPKGSKSAQKFMVEKSFDTLTAADIKEHWKLVEASIRKEVQSFWDLKTFKVSSRASVSNICSSRWIHKWKLIDGQRCVKSRLTIRGYEDMTVSSVNFAGTASRWGQRIINSICVQRKWPLFITDISSAFLQGLTFKQISELEGTELRKVAFTPPTGSERFFSEVKGMEAYNWLLEVLEMLKPVYGLKDAPRAWRIKLDQSLRAAGGIPLHTDAALYAWFDNGVLVMIVSAHVDDLKGCGREDVVTFVLQKLTAEFGVLKTSWNTFEHCGLKYERDMASNTLSIHQNHYAAQLKLFDPVVLAMPSQTPLPTLAAAQFLSLLGAVAWLIQARIEVAIYFCALQRSAKAPRVEHAQRLNKVTKWVKRRASKLFYRYLQTPCRVMVISDSAFRKECLLGLAMRGALIGIGESNDDHPGGNFHLVEYFARKQRRVTRSTYSAELHGLNDSYEMGKVICLTLSECIQHHPQARTLIALEEAGGLPIPLECCIDAKSVFDSLAAKEVRPPSEVSLIMVLHQMKEGLLSWTLSRLWWCDTHDMAADGLNKGSCSREGLMTLANTGVWTLKNKAISHKESRHIPVKNVAVFIDEIGRALPAD